MDIFELRWNVVIWTTKVSDECQVMRKRQEYYYRMKEVLMQRRPKEGPNIKSANLRRRQALPPLFHHHYIHNLMHGLYI